MFRAKWTGRRGAGVSDGARFEAKRVGAHLRNRAENGERLSPHMLVKMPPQIGDDEKLSEVHQYRTWNDHKT